MRAVAGVRTRPGAPAVKPLSRPSRHPVPVARATLSAPAVTHSVDVMENEQLTVQRAIDGDQAAMRALWTRHAPHIDVVVRRLVGHDPDLAADVAQEVWIQIFRALPGFRGDAQFGTWAHRIAVNRTLNALRRTQAHGGDGGGGGGRHARRWSRKRSGRCSRPSIEEAAAQAVARRAHGVPAPRRRRLHARGDRHASSASRRAAPSRNCSRHARSCARCSHI